MKCPKCNEEMTIKKLKGIAIDKCEKCNGIWLDKGELNALKEKILEEQDCDDNFAVGIAMGGLLF